MTDWDIIAPAYESFYGIRLTLNEADQYHPMTFYNRIINIKGSVFNDVLELRMRWKNDPNVRKDPVLFVACWNSRLAVKQGKMTKIKEVI